MDYDEEFQTYFVVDGYGALVKAALFTSSSLNCLSEKEILPACILGYYSLFHLSLALVFLNPEKTAGHHNFLVELKDIRKKGPDPQDGIKHNKLIEILRDMKFHKLSSELAHGKKIREFYNYGPRTTFDDNGDMFFGNPIGTSESERIFPDDAIKFCQNIDEIINEQVSLCIKSIYKVTLYALASQFGANSHYLKDESLHLINLFSKETIGSAKRILREFEDMIDTRITFVDSVNSKG